MFQMNHITINVSDEHERTFIDLPDDVVKLLDVDETFPYDQLETQLENVSVLRVKNM